MREERLRKLFCVTQSESDAARMPDAHRCALDFGLGRGWLWGMAHNFVHIGQKEIWGGRSPLVISGADRRRHLYIIGQTGTGKSTLIKNIIAQDIEAGQGCALIDPHGDLAHEVLDVIPRNRVDDVVVLDPSDTDRPPGYNPFFRVPKDERSLVAANITSTFKHIWRNSWGPRLEYILYNTVAAILDAPDELRPCFLSIPLVFVRRDYRDRIVSCIEDPRVRSFFEDEFSTWNERQLAENLSSVQNKIGQFLSNPFVRNILGQWKPSINITDIMASNKILIVRLSKGTLGEEPANLLGSLVATGFQQAAMRRAAIPEAERQDFHLHIDEFQNFTTDSFASVLSEARKYGLTITAGNQFLDQLSDEVRSAVFGNVGGVISFRVSANDADVLAKEIGEYSPKTFRDLGIGEICVRLLNGGEVSAPCLGVTGYSDCVHGNGKNVRHQSRMRYGTDRKKVEARIAAWLT